MSEISAYFAVGGSTWRGVQVDTEGKTSDEIADLIDREFSGVSLCHQCASECEDPEAELTGFTLDNVDYELVDGHWTARDVRAAELRGDRVEGQQ